MVYKVELQEVDKQIKIVKKLVKKCHTHGDITLLDHTKWILSIPAGDVRRGYWIALADEEPFEVVDVTYVPRHQEDFFGTPDLYRYLIDTNHKSTLIKIDTMVRLYTECTKLTQDETRMFVYDFWNDTSSIIIDIDATALDYFLKKTHHLALKEQRRKSIAHDCLRITYRMPFWTDSRETRTQRGLRHSRKTVIPGVPKLEKTNYGRLVDNFKYTNRFMCPGMASVGENINARTRYGGAAIRTAKGM